MPDHSLYPIPAACDCEHCSGAASELNAWHDEREDREDQVEPPDFDIEAKARIRGELD